MTLDYNSYPSELVEGGVSSLANFQGATADAGLGGKGGKEDGYSR